MPSSDFEYHINYKFTNHISWKLLSTAKFTELYLQLRQGSAKLRENLKPNEKPVEVDESVQENIRQVKTVAGKTSF